MPIRILVTVILGVFLAGCSPHRGVYHTVREGQTLYRISRTYGADERFLARINGISDPTRLTVGQRLFIPGAEQTKTVPSTVLAKPVPVASKEPSRQSPSRKNPPAAEPSLKTKPIDTPKNQIAGSRSPVIAKGKFTWPLKGEIVKEFTAEAGAPTKGLEIAAPRGTPVLSAAAGKVIYSGNGISGYGNLIILKHDDSFFTVYGFNDKNLVESGSFVSKAQRIALSGAPPGGATPRLHFEIRYGKKAVNPIFYLP
jgi:lipoprotein NlpD